MERHERGPPSLFYESSVEPPQPLYERVAVQEPSYRVETQEKPNRESSPRLNRNRTQSDCAHYHGHRYCHRSPSQYPYLPFSYAFVFLPSAFYQ